ncbi:flagellar motor switch protein FliN [Sanguibacter antarcticus]|uniref:Flagellar motor switch protein FliN/FliY n=1 Tax=Sanguibacter antarcticus TaxID=372484 RepID=A0A2A9E1K1_9MICO|nr:flagellar motor switch protein FliN [Sanguibacter antarcticus]PFG32245.1 flagellar motor switch protein FliN/FliY [Sanguibacter antarcticus]
MNTPGAGTDQSLAQDAADALALLIPSEVPLVAVPRSAGTGPAPDQETVSAAFVGGRSAELILAAGSAIGEALAGAGALVSVADALRPALEAAAATLGEGVLGAAETRDAGTAFDDDDVLLFALEGAGEVRGWFGLRLRPDLSKASPAATGRSGSSPDNLRLLYDVEMTLTAEIGRAKLPVRQVLDLVPGTVIELDRVAGSPADLMVNGRLIARGEVVVIDEDYGLRITEIVDHSEATA